VRLPPPPKILRSLGCAALLLVSACKYSGPEVEADQRVSDTPIIPGYVVSAPSLKVQRDPLNPTRLTFEAPAGSYGFLGGTPAALKIAVYSVSEEELSRLISAPKGTTDIAGRGLGVLLSEPDGSVRETSITLSQDLGYLLVFVYDRAGGMVAFPTAIEVPDATAIYATISETSVGFFANLFPQTPIGLWANPEVLRTLNRNTSAYNLIVSRAYRDSLWESTDLGNPDLNVAPVLTAAIAYTVDPVAHAALRTKIISVVGSLLEQGQPEGPTVTYASRIPAVLAALDLIGYRTAAFDNYLVQLANVWKGTFWGGQATIREVWVNQANTAAGMQAMLALVAIHSYLRDTGRLNGILAEWRSMLSGTPFNPNLTWRKPAWQIDSSKRYFVLPPGTRVTCGGVLRDLSGAMPEFMDTNNPCAHAANPIIRGWEAWKSVEAMASAARMAESQGKPGWATGANAILRAATALESTFHTPINPYPGMAWVLRFIDMRYGTELSCQVQGMPGSFVDGGGYLGYSWIVTGGRHITCSE
jgi:hypothetical protein